MKKIMKQWIAFILAVVIMFGDCSTSYGAEITVENVETEVQEETELLHEMPTEQKDAAALPQVLFEVEELREQSVKQYRLSDGTVLAAQYGMDVHYENEKAIGKRSTIDFCMKRQKHEKIFQVIPQRKVQWSISLHRSQGREKSSDL